MRKIVPTFSKAMFWIENIFLVIFFIIYDLCLGIGTYFVSFYNII